MSALLEVQGLSKRFGGLTATDNLNLDVREGEIHALIGPNGAGKTTAIAQLCGEIPPNAGTIRFAGEDITALTMPQRVAKGLARSFQITSVLPEFSALDNVALAVQIAAGSSFRFWKNARADRSLTDPARALLAEVGLGHRGDVRTSDLAHGEQRQLELAMALATKPRLLLLDEPMAGMGQTESRAMTDFLLSLKGRITMLLVEHDMEAVFALADRITVLVYGHAVATGTPAEIRDDPAVKAAYLGDGEEAV